MSVLAWILRIIRGGYVETAPDPVSETPHVNVGVQKETPMKKDSTMNTVEIVVDRNFSNARVTLSDIYVDGSLICHGLEDEHRTVKVWGNTRIPKGIYEISLRTFGGFHDRYSKASWIKDVHEGMLWVRNVPNFEAILIHVGNTKKDTAGCLLVGMSRHENKEAVYLSRAAYKKLYSLILPALKRGDRVTIEYQDNEGSV